MSTMTAITGTIKNGELQTTKDLALFPDGTEVIILSRADFNVIAGSDSARHQASDHEAGTNTSQGRGVATSGRERGDCA